MVGADHSGNPNAAEHFYDGKLGFKRVLGYATDENGVAQPILLSIEGSLIVSPFPVQATPVTKINTNFTVTETFDINDVLGRNATQFTVILDGLNAIDVSISNDGSSFGNEHRMLVKNETYPINGISVDSIRITHTGDDSAYRIVAL